ncbi:MAG: helix-turn-helix domain-containing protein [Bacteroidales bacterium]
MEQEVKKDFSLAKDFAIFDRVDQIHICETPTRMDCVVFAICTRGSLEVGVNLEKLTLKKQQLGVIRPDQILQLIDISEDFEGRFLVMSRNFLEEAQIDFKSALTIFFYFRDNPCTDLTDTEMEMILEYHSLLLKKMKLNDPIFRKKIAQHLMRALFCEVNMLFAAHQSEQLIRKKNRKELLFEQFMKTVAQYYKKERSVSFYGDKMCLTPKYLSTTIKEISGKLAGEWIDEFVILEAKTLLKNSGKNIQEVAEELNFPNQSFFGKYFKQHTGMSPSQYKGELK